MKLKFPLNSHVIASPDGAPVQEFNATVIDYIEAVNLYIVKDQDDDVWQCTEDELEETD